MVARGLRGGVRALDGVWMGQHTRIHAFACGRTISRALRHALCKRIHLYLVVSHGCAVDRGLHARRAHYSGFRKAARFHDSGAAL